MIHIKYDKTNNSSILTWNHKRENEESKYVEGNLLRIFQN